MEPAEQADDDVCEAKLDDRDSVIAIDDDVYDGIDFLPDTYLTLLQQDGVRCFLYKKEGKIIGFMSTQLINGQQTLLVTAVRIAKEYRGSRVFARFKELAVRKYLDDIRSAAPKLCKITFAVHDRKMTENPQYIQVASKKLTSFEVTMSDRSLDYLKLAKDLPEMRELLPDEVKYICKNGEACHLFPDGRIILGWKPYQAMAENVGVFTHPSLHRVFLVKKTTDEETPPTDKVPLPLPHFLSAGSHFNCKRGIYYITDLFGDTSNEDLCGHINWHMKRLSEIAEETKQNVVFSICYSKTLHNNVLENLQKCYALRKINLCLAEIIAMEQELPCTNHQYVEDISRQ